jgi:outer membrane protein assembly factor BamB
MQILKSKTLAIAIAMFLTISIGASLMLIPSANAHTPPWKIPTFAYVLALPNPVGVGQTTTIYMFLGNPPYPSSALNNDYRFHNYELTITDPNGKNTTKTFETIQDPTNSQFYPFTPETVGTYNLTFVFPGQNVNDYPHADNDYVNDTFLPSTYTSTLTVQEAPISTIPAVPLPTEYWTRPIYGTNTNWWVIASNWLGSGITGYGSMPGPNEQMFSGDSIGPLTSHIMWTKPLQSGGVVGGNNYVIQGNTYFEGSAYNQRFTNPIILNGKLYYTEPISFTDVPSFFGGGGGPTDCVDLRTGELIWSRSDIPALSFGLIWDHEDPNQHGVFPAILATSNFGQLFDADTGDAMFNVTSVPSGTSVLGPNGEVLKYVATNLGTPTNPNYVLAEWNSTKLWNFIVNPYTGGSLLSPSIITTAGILITSIPIPIAGTSGTFPNGSSVRVPYGSTITVNGGVFDSSSPQNRYDWNVSIPWANSMPAVGGGPFGPPSPFSILSVFPGNLLLCRNGSYPALGAYNPYTYFAINLNASRTGYRVGDVLWYNTVQPPSGKNITTVTYAGADPTAGVFCESYRQTTQFVGYSLTDGKQIWGPTEGQTPLDYYGSQGPGTLADQIAYGRIYSSAYGGILYCYDMKTGDIIFTYGNGGEGNRTNSGFEVPGHYPTFVNAIGNDVVYLVTSEHTIQTPIYKGALMRAVNATTGKEIWTLSNDNNEFAAESFAMADGFAVTFNGYDNQIYSIGRGPSATTVSASPKVSVFGTHVLIEGTVTDIAVGTQQNEQAARFPHGVAAVSDANMADWMGYVYQQQPFPSNCTGVPVSINVWDSNNNYRNIGTAISDVNGFYSFEWTPDIPGKFTVIANFEGTNGYWPSYAETAFTLTEAQPTATPTPMPGSNTDAYVTAFGIGIIVAIIIVGVVLALMLRRRS